MRIPNSIVKVASVIFLISAALMSLLFFEVLLQLRENSNIYHLLMQIPLWSLITIFTLGYILNRKVVFALLCITIWCFGFLLSVVGYTFMAFLLGISTPIIEGIVSLSPNTILFFVVFSVAFLFNYAGVYWIYNKINQRPYTNSWSFPLLIASLAQISAILFWVQYSHWWFVN